MEQSINYIEQIDILTEEVERELERLIGSRSISEMTLEELRFFEKEFTSLKNLNDELYSQMEENITNENEEDVELAKDSSSELSIRVESRLQTIKDEIKVKEPQAQDNKQTQDDKPYYINDEIMDLFLKNGAIKAKRKDELKAFGGRDLTEEEFNQFSELVSDTLLHVNYKDGQIRSGIVQQNVLFNFEKNARTDKLKQMLRVYNGRSLTRTEINFLKNHILHDFITDEQMTMAEPKNDENQEEQTNSANPDEQTEANIQDNQQTNNDNSQNTDDSTSSSGEGNASTQDADKDKKTKVDYSIQGYIDRGVLPNNMDEATLVGLCNSLGIPANDLTHELTAQQLDRLKKDPVIEVALNNQKIVDAHKYEINKIGSIIEKYQRILDISPSVNFSPEFLEKIRANLQMLEEQKAEYEAKVANIRYDSVEEHFELAGSVVTKGSQKKSANRNQERASKFNEELKKEYAEYDKLSEQHKNALSDSTKKRLKRKMDKVHNRIKDLQRKTGNMTRKQIKVVNENSRVYLDKIYRRRLTSEDREKIATEQANRIIDAENEIQALAAEQAKAHQDLQNMPENTPKERRDRAAVERDMKKMERQIEALRRKQGVADFTYQVSQTFARTR